MSTYMGTRSTDGQRTVVTVDGKPLRHIVKHSPTGFEWGYGGSGPSDLALAIMADFLGTAPSPQLYHDFKFEFVQHWGDSWTIETEEIELWFEERKGR